MMKCLDMLPCPAFQLLLIWDFARMEISMCLELDSRFLLLWISTFFFFNFV